MGLGFDGDCKAYVAVNIVYEGLLKPLASQNDLNIGPDTHQWCTKPCADNAAVEQRVRVYTRA